MLVLLVIVCPYRCIKIKSKQPGWGGSLLCFKLFDKTELTGHKWNTTQRNVRCVPSVVFMHATQHASLLTHSSLLMICSHVSATVGKACWSVKVSILRCVLNWCTKPNWVNTHKPLHYNPLWFQSCQSDHWLMWLATAMWRRLGFSKSWVCFNFLTTAETKCSH